MTDAEMDAALASPAPKGAAKSMTDEEMSAALAGSKIDVGPETRRVRGGGSARPEPKSDAELGIDEGPEFYRGAPVRGRADRSGILGNTVSTAREAPGTDAYARAHSGDEMNDPGAQMLTAGAIAAPIAALAGAGAVAAGAPSAAPLVSGAVAGGSQAASTGQDPRIGALLGALPGVGRAARAADTAVGEKALELATRPSTPSVLPKAGKVLGAIAGGAKGLAMGGPVGMGTGGYVGAKAGQKIGEAVAGGIDKATGKLAQRYLLQQAREALAEAAELPGASAALSAHAARDLAHITTPETTTALPARAAPRATGFSADSPPIPPPRAALAALAHEPLPPPSSVPPGALGTPFIDEFGVPVTNAAPAGHATVGGATVARPRLKILDENGRDLMASPPSLRSDVMRDVRAFRDAPYDAEPAPKGSATPETAGAGRPDIAYDKAQPAAPDVGGQLADTVKVLDLMRQAHAAGTLTPAMIRSAVALGMPRAAIAKAIGTKALEAATKR